MEHASLVTVDAGARRNGLADLVARLCTEHLHDPRRRRLLVGLRAVVGLSASDAGVALTLAFRPGGLTVYDGLRGDADVVIEARGEELVSLALIRLVVGYPLPLDARGRELVRQLASGRLRIRGLLFHPLLVARLARLLAVPADPASSSTKEP
jgi:hypothetical protein